MGLGGECPRFQEGSYGCGLQERRETRHIDVSAALTTEFMLPPTRAMRMIPHLLAFSCSEQLTLTLCPALQSHANSVMLCLPWELALPFKDALRYGAAVHIWCTGSVGLSLWDPR